MNSPKISVLIPYYNDKDYLKDSIQSVLKQSFKDFELILLNHASTDGSREIAHSFKDERIIHIDMEKNFGAGGGILLETMVKKASGEFIKFFCADDLMTTNCLRSLWKAKENNKNIDILFSNMEYIDCESKDLHDDWFNNRENFNVNDNEIDCLIKYKKYQSFLPWSGSFVRSKILENIIFDKTLIMLFDMSIWVQLLLNGSKLLFVRDKLIQYRIHEGQVSSVKNKSNIEVRFFFEKPVYEQYFSNTRQIKVIKEVFEDSVYINKLKTIEGIKFITAKYFWDHSTDQGSFLNLYRLFTNPDSARNISNEFCYDISDLRYDYSYQRIFGNNQTDVQISELKSENLYKRFKHKIFETPSKCLQLHQLVFLLLRRVITIFNFRLHHQKSNKKYSM